MEEDKSEDESPKSYVRVANVGTKLEGQKDMLAARLAPIIGAQELDFLKKHNILNSLYQSRQDFLKRAHGPEKPGRLNSEFHSVLAASTLQLSDHNLAASPRN